MAFQCVFCGDSGAMWLHRPDSFCACQAGRALRSAADREVIFVVTNMSGGVVSASREMPTHIDGHHVTAVQLPPKGN